MEDYQSDVKRELFSREKVQIVAEYYQVFWAS